MRVLVGGVSQLYQGDHDLGRRAVERLQQEDLGPDVSVEDLYYGAVAVVQRLQESQPTSLILIGTHERGRVPGTVDRRVIGGTTSDGETIQRSVGDAVVGYVDLDITIDVLAGFGALPPRAVVFDVEPARTTPTEELSPEASRALEEVIGLVKTEVRRDPLFELRRRVAETLDPERLEPSPALSALQELLAEIERVEETGTWGATFALRDRFRFAIGAGETGEGMDHLDWGLWWALIEELDRLQSSEASPI